MKFADADRVINLLGPDHHGYVGRMRAAMQALGHPPEAFEVLIVQLVTLLRDGQPVRMSKRRGEFVLMEELLEEVGPRRRALHVPHAPPRQPARVRPGGGHAPVEPTTPSTTCSTRTRASARSRGRRPSRGSRRRRGTTVDTGALAEPEEQALIKRLLQLPEMVAGAARALEPHRVALLAAGAGRARSIRITRPTA